MPISPWISNRFRSSAGRHQVSKLVVHGQTFNSKETYQCDGQFLFSNGYTSLTQGIRESLELQLILSYLKSKLYIAVKIKIETGRRRHHRHTQQRHTCGMKQRPVSNPNYQNGGKQAFPRPDSNNT